MPFASSCTSLEGLDLPFCRLGREYLDLLICKVEFSSSFDRMLFLCAPPLLSFSFYKESDLGYVCHLHLGTTVCHQNKQKGEDSVVTSVCSTFVSVCCVVSCC